MYVIEAYPLLFATLFIILHTDAVFSKPLSVMRGAAQRGAAPCALWAAAIATLAAAASSQPVAPALAPGSSFSVTRASVFPAACAAELSFLYGRCVADCTAGIAFAVDSAGAFFSATPLPPPGSPCSCLAGGGELDGRAFLLLSFPFGVWASGPRLSVNLSASSCSTWTARGPDDELDTSWYGSPPLECSATYAAASPAAPCFSAAGGRQALALPAVAMNLTLRRAAVGPAFCSDAALARSSSLYTCTSECSRVMLLSKPADGGLFSLVPAFDAVGRCNCSGSATSLLPQAGHPLTATFRSGVTAVLESYTVGGGGADGGDYARPLSGAPSPAPGPASPPQTYFYNSTLGSAWRGRAAWCMLTHALFARLQACASSSPRATARASRSRPLPAGGGRSRCSHAPPCTWPIRSHFRRGCPA
jgi:hypothetical protein